MYTPQFNKPRILSVSQINFYIKSLVENDPRLSLVFLTGEISNMTTNYRSGHIYLSIKDEKSVIRAVMFAGNARLLKFKPMDGMKVICRGRIAVYEPSGQYQLYIEDMQPDGIGELSLAFEQLKARLAENGLFEQSHKKPLPRFPKTVGVITSPTGAAVQDIRNILFRRFPCINVVMCPVLVQGEFASGQLVNAIKQLDENKLCDVIIIGRGGGSIEDLWAFNSEELAYAIYNCETPVISAVGHETDFTICDFVADVRASTPSAGAELAVPDKDELMAYYNSQIQYLKAMIDLKIKNSNDRLSDYEKRIQYSVTQKNIAENEYRLSEIQLKLNNIISHIINEKELAITENAAKLESLNPIAVLSRGYAIPEKDGKAVISSKQLNKDDVFTVKFSDGDIKAQVL
ncbi:MAG: exodeoxyribonuclease VII large subunit [Ruminococcus sp.]|nr:exodeoxyribonuclease VII large subunit [Ruminococcus sp.]